MIFFCFLLMFTNCTLKLAYTLGTVWRGERVCLLHQQLPSERIWILASSY